MAGKVTIGLASHWPHITDISGSPRLQAQGLGEGDEHLPTPSCGAWSTLPLPLPRIVAVVDHNVTSMKHRQ